MKRARVRRFISLVLFGCLLPVASVRLTAAEEAKADTQAFLDAVESLNKHISGQAELDNAAVEALTEQLNANKAALASSKEAVRASMNLVSTFDSTKGALWVKHAPMNKKEKKPENATKWAVFWVMQNLMDEVYNSAGMEKYSDLIDGFRFGSADHLPGKVEAKPDPDETYTVKIRGGYPETWGSPVFHMDNPARKPTGAYLVPGTIATVIVPEALVNKGYQVRVGAHSWDHSRKPRVLRLYRVSALYDINSTEIKVANPLGGGIYIEVPYKTEAGVVEVSVRNAVRSPYFSWKSFHKTTLKEWQEVERHHKAPWADFQSDKYMMQVPTGWIYALDDPVTLMKNWDKSLDAFNDVMGRPHDFGREILYNQVDLQLRGRAFHPGYPSGNRGYDPNEETDGYREHHLIQGPQNAHSYEFHELGHGFLFPKYAGDRESAVNLPHVGVMNKAFGKELDEAFRGSRSMDGNKFKTVDTAAIAWMMSDNFINDGFMKGYERSYQLKGHAKYIDIVRLFGWEAITKFFHSTEEDYMNGNPWPRNNDGEDGDRYTIRLSESAGADLRPLIHFWGIPIVDEAKADAAIEEAGIKPSAKVYDLLVKYKSLVPENKEAFREYALKWWDKEPSPEGYTTERNHAARWESYDEQMAERTRSSVQAIINRYFPNGRPEDNE